MITTVLIDDEPYALSEMEYFLKKYPEISIVGKYTDPQEAMERIGELNPRAVFLDINMPQLAGLDAASLILDLCPETDIIFATAYSEYAIEAFELNAADYILKPIDEERLQKTVQRLVKKSFAPGEATRQKLKIRCFGGFQMYWEGREPIKWRAEKTKELFAYLFHHVGRDISKEELLDRLWPDDAPEKAIRQLYNGIYYIRKALVQYGIDRKLISINSNYCLTLGEVEVDIKRFLDLEKRSAASAAELDSIYKGDYLEGEYYSWAVLERERLSQLYARYLNGMAQSLLQKGQWDKAESLLVKACNKNPYEEDSIELLLKLYMERGSKSKAVKQYKAYEKLLKDELGIVPSPKIKEIIDRGF